MARDGTIPRQVSAPSGESQQERWFSWDEAFAAADPGLVGALHKLRMGTDRSGGAVRADGASPG